MILLNEIKTGSFNGLNRLPVIGEGEGAVFKNLSLSDYPVAKSEGTISGEDVYILADGVRVKVDSSKLQAVGKLTRHGSGFLLTGVYDGVFYDEGVAVEYYGDLKDGYRIESGDRVEIERSGTRYVILAVKADGRSVIWSYNTLGTSTGTDTEGDGMLNTEVLAYRLPPKPIVNLVLFKPCEKDNDDTRIGRIQSASGKEYYMLFFYTKYEDDKRGRICKQAKDAFDIYNSYYGLIGSTLLLKPLADTTSFNPDKYCFDDLESEHPVRFVIDAASLGTANGGDIDAFDYLYDVENERYDVQTMENRTYDILLPYNMTTASSYSYIPIFNEDGTLITCNNDVDTEGSGIIGHFERWNEETKRYEFYNSTDNNPIYQPIDEEGNPIYPTEDNEYYNTTNSNRRSYTGIPLAYAGLVNDSMKLSHIALVGNRVYASVKGGAQILYSSLGKYTSFSELTGAGADSGFLDDSTIGEFTGLCGYSGSLLAFKEDRIVVYYGTPPSITRSRDILGVGCIDCRSIKEIGGVLYFLARDGFYAYSGGMPRKLSRKLKRTYTSAIAYERDGHYEVEATNKAGTRERLTYYPELDMWTEGDAVGVAAEKDGAIIGDDGCVHSFYDDVTEGSWVYETGDIYESDFHDKGINELYIRGILSGRMKVTTISDNEESEHTEIVEDGTRGLSVWRVPVRLKHRNHYRIRIEGEGYCVLYAIERNSYIGGKKR